MFNILWMNVRMNEMKCTNFKKFTSVNRQIKDFKMWFLSHLSSVYFKLFSSLKYASFSKNTKLTLLLGYYFISDKKLKLSIISWLLKFILRKDALIRLWFELWDLIGRVTIMLTILSTYENTWCCSRVFFIAGSTGTLISSRAFNIWDKNADKLELRKKAWSSYSCKKKRLKNDFFFF